MRGAYFASDFDGETGGERIRACLDAVAQERHHGIAIVGPDGPDDGRWLLRSALELPSHATLVLCGACLALAPGTNDNLLRNRAAASSADDRDAEIHVVGIGDARLDGDGANQERQDAMYENYGIHLFGVDGCSLSGLRIESTNAWGVALEDVTEAVVTDLRFRQDGHTPNQDGIHVSGPGRNVAVANVTGTVGDDAVAVDAAGSASDARSPARGSGGALSNVAVANVSVTNASAGAALRTVAASDAPLDGVTATNLHASPAPDADGGSPVLKIGWDRGVPRSRGWDAFDRLPAPADHRNVLVSNVVGETDATFCSIESSVSTLTIRGVRGSHGGPALRVSEGDVETVRLEDWVTTLRNGATGIAVETDGSCRDLTVSASRFTAGGETTPRGDTGLRLAGGTDPLTASGVRVRDVTFRGFDTGIATGTAELTDRLEVDDVRFEAVDVACDVGGSLLRDGVGVSTAAGVPDRGAWSVGDIVCRPGRDALLAAPDGEWIRLGTPIRS